MFDFDKNIRIQLWNDGSTCPRIVGGPWKCSKHESNRNNYIISKWSEIFPVLKTRTKTGDQTVCTHLICCEARETYRSDLPTPYWDCKQKEGRIANSIKEKIHWDIFLTKYILNVFYMIMKGHEKSEDFPKYLFY